MDLGADGATSATLAAAGVQASKQQNQAMKSHSDSNLPAASQATAEVPSGEPAEHPPLAYENASEPTPQAPSPIRAYGFPLSLAHRI